jgi:hypothetical protein
MRLEIFGDTRADAASALVDLVRARWHLNVLRSEHEDLVALTVEGFEPDDHPVVSQSLKKLREAELAEVVVTLREADAGLTVRMLLPPPHMPDAPVEATQVQMEAAIVHLSEAFRKFLVLKDGPQIAETATFLGNLLALGQLYEQANFFFGRARDIYVRLGEDDRAAALEIIIQALGTDMDAEEVEVETQGEG